MCDTFVALPSAPQDGSLIFGKNSDREPNEAQALEYYPPQDYREGTRLQCTYIRLPQASHTNAVLLSRPFWMWGAEIGANEHGVVIGNEAVFTKMPMKKEEKLTGMDLLRLALERANTAETALEVITELLAEFGQGGPCGYQDKKLVYHNSYILADPRAAWVLETAGPLWAALKVKDFYSISNGLTIGEEFDLSHPDLIDTARQNGWLKKGGNFHFARAYSDWFYTTFSACHTRHNRSSELLRKNSGLLDVQAAFSLLRDHGDSPYRPDSHFLIKYICAHAANPLSRHAAQSTASFIANLRPDSQTYWATGSSAPCTGIFKPVWFTKNGLPDIGPAPGGTFTPETLWWQHEQLHRLVLGDYRNRLERYQRERDGIETSFINQSRNIAPPERWNFSCECFRQARVATETWIKRIKEESGRNQMRLFYRWYWKRQNQLAQIRV